MKTKARLSHNDDDERMRFFYFKIIVVTMRSVRGHCSGRKSSKTMLSRAHSRIVLCGHVIPILLGALLSVSHTTERCRMHVDCGTREQRAKRKQTAKEKVLQRRKICHFSLGYLVDCCWWKKTHTIIARMPDLNVQLPGHSTDANGSGRRRRRPRRRHTHCGCNNAKLCNGRI